MFHWSSNQTMTHIFKSSLFHLSSQNHNHFSSVGFTIWRVNNILRPETLDSREERLPRHNKKKPGNREKKRGRNVGESQTIHCHFIKSFLERFVLLIHHNLNKSCIYCLVDTLLAAAESFQTSLLWSFCVESPHCPLLI